MGTTHRLKYNGYDVGDRLLEDAYFAVIIEIDETSAQIVGIEPWDENEADYLQQFNMEYFKPRIINDLKHAIEYLSKTAIEEQTTIEELMKEYHEETEEPGIQLFVDV